MFRIPFIPTKRRVRVTRYGAYDPPENKREAFIIASLWDNECGTCYEEPVVVVIDVFAKLPSSRPKRIKSEPNVYKPDADNVAKAILDALNGHAFKDDRFVIELVIRKHDRVRKDSECVMVSVTPIRELDMYGVEDGARNQK